MKTERDELGMIRTYLSSAYRKKTVAISAVGRHGAGGTA